MFSPASAPRGLAVTPSPSSRRPSHHPPSYAWRPQLTTLPAHIPRAPAALTAAAALLFVLATAGHAAARPASLLADITTGKSLAEAPGYTMRSDVSSERRPWRNAVPEPSYRYPDLIHLPACLPACLPVCLSVCLPACLAVLPLPASCLPACLPACLEGRGVVRQAASLPPCNRPRAQPLHQRRRPPTRALSPACTDPPRRRTAPRPFACQAT
jgi:hypothetical protein